MNNALGIISPLPAIPSNTVARDKPLTESGFVKLLTCATKTPHHHNGSRLTGRFCLLTFCGHALF
jgi:hypothetical protein